MSVFLWLVFGLIALGLYLRHREKRLYRLLNEFSFVLFLPTDRAVQKLRWYGLAGWEIAWLLEHRRESIWLR